MPAVLCLPGSQRSLQGSLRPGQGAGGLAGRLQLISSERLEQPEAAAYAVGVAADARGRRVPSVCGHTSALSAADPLGCTLHCRALEADLLPAR